MLDLQVLATCTLQGCLLYIPTGLLPILALFLFLSAICLTPYVYGLASSAGALKPALERLHTGGVC